MQPIEMNDPTKIEEFLSKISLGGKGFTTECLLVDAYDAGLEYPDYLNAEGKIPMPVMKENLLPGQNTICGRESEFLWSTEIKVKIEGRISRKRLDPKIHLKVIILFNLFLSLLLCSLIKKPKHEF